MRVWLNGRASSFQVDHAGSIPAARSMITRNRRRVHVPLAAWEPGDPYHALRPRWAASAARAAYTDRRPGTTPVTADVVQRQNCGFPSRRRGFDPRHPLASVMLPWPSGQGASLTPRTSWVRIPSGARSHGDVAQQVGHLASNEKAAGSTPAISTTPTTSRRSKQVRWRSAPCMRAHGHITAHAPAIGYGTRSHARIAQPAERRSRKAQVRGSTPRAGSMASMTRCRSPSAVGSTPAIDGIVRVAQLAARLHDPQVVRGSIPRADTARR